MPTKDDVVEALKTVEDPELFLDIWFLGLVYDIRLLEEEHKAEIDMTFTTPMCPAGPQLIEEVKGAVEGLDGIEEAEVKVVFDPPWEPSDDVKAMLGMM